MNPGEPIVLPRGGALFETRTGCIQYGAVPETIKDTMAMSCGVPAIYVIPPRMFDTGRGIALAELEFPAYYNFFLKRCRIRVVCRREQRAIFERVFGESLFGPDSLDPEEFAGSHREELPDLQAELAYFRRNPLRGGAPLQLEDLVEFVEFDPAGRAELGDGVSITAEDDGGICILEAGIVRWRWKGGPPLPPPRVPESGVLKAFRGPLLGVSVLGSGHGFDPGNRTSGFVVWVESEGVMVDPPVDWADWFAGFDIHPKQIDTLILTHCHADHDAGTLQKIMAEGRITIYATPTVMRSFVRKYAALTGLTAETFRDLFDWVPVKTGEPTFIHGARVEFRYSLHSIPCTGFEMSLRNRSLVYPSDTMNVPERIRQLHADGVLSSWRRDSLLAFPWHHTLVIHEAGIPPIHTPIETLASLSEDVKKRLLLVHTGSRSVPEGSNLSVAPTGLERTVDLAPERLEFQEALRWLDAMSRVEILAGLSVSRGCEFLRMARLVRFEQGEVFIREGRRGDDFYILLSGQAEVRVEDRRLKVYSAYDYLGETALVLDQPRTADVAALTPIEALALGRHAFLHLIRGTGLEQKLAGLARQRERASWELLGRHRILGSLTTNQKNQLELCMSPLSLEAGAVLGERPVLVEHGTLELVTASEQPACELGAGELALDPAAVMRGGPWSVGFRARSRVRGYVLEPGDFRGFLRNNPGVYLQLLDLSAGWGRPVTQ